MHIVVVEDNISVAKGIRYYLQDIGHAVDVLDDGADADAFLRQDEADLIVLDINLPTMDGLCVLREMRARNDNRPVLLLTARAETEDKITGLDAGADDYLSKPFEMAEFGARIRALSRRVGERPMKVATIGPLRFDKTARMVAGPDGPLNIPRREVALFERLLSADGRIVSKQVLLDSLYGTGADVDEPVVEVYVSRLRKRLRPFGVQIVVKRGLGYLMRMTP
ncbi:two-component system, OmpR family, response regulator [Cognatiyoonia koreensis]|uniref:Two-component system, OmpR family, response regulator n=1 Tax=Cognatiyoonia koreensis TaxID=364200 RepID=A0A1I0PU08_9RHOB|nr:response regulator transcription factor [Cognatiyoonia koreensis]SEW17924.1 two-component system, OmpR family, response regulator [Cognatiyoonia koreensis]